MPVTYTNTIPQYIARLAQNAPLGALAAAESIAVAMNDTVPVDTGELDASIVSRLVDPPDPAIGLAEVTAGEGIGDARAIYTEYGTSKQPAQFWARRAIESVRESLPGIIADKLKES